MKPQKQDLLHFQGVPPPGDGARVATYRRYSSGKQKATTLQKQQDSIEESLDELHPTWRILPDGEYADPKKTARDDTFENRPGLQQLIADAQAGKFDVVIVESVDRWSRSSAVTWNTLAILHACGVYWMTTDGFDSVTIRQEGTSASFAHAAEAAAQVSRTISKKVVRGKRTRTKQGYHGSHAPFGYQRGELDENNRRNYEPHPDLFPALAIIRDMSIAGQTDQDIASELNRQGYYAPPTDQGQRVKGLHDESVQHMDKRPITARLIVGTRHNRFYVRFQPDSDRGITWTKREGVEREGRHVAAWTQEEWAAMQAAKRPMQNRPNATPRARRTWPFGGIMICQQCGLVMQCAAHKRYKERGDLLCYYQCRRTSACRPQSVRAEYLEDAFGALLEHLDDAGWRETLTALVQQDVEPPPDHAAERERLETAIRRENIKLDAGGITEAEYKRNVKRLRADLARVPIPRANPVQERQHQAAETMATIAKCWQAAPLTDKREMTTLLLQQPGAVYDRRDKRIVAVRPHDEFALVFQAALGWEMRDSWLWHPAQREVA